MKEDPMLVGFIRALRRFRTEAVAFEEIYPESNLRRGLLIATAYSYIFNPISDNSYIAIMPVKMEPQTYISYDRVKFRNYTHNMLCLRYNQNSEFLKRIILPTSAQNILNTFERIVLRRKQGEAELIQTVEVLSHVGFLVRDPQKNDLMTQGGFAKNRGK